jgi:hypothetical protein
MALRFRWCANRELCEVNTEEIEYASVMAGILEKADSREPTARITVRSAAIG